MAGFADISVPLELAERLAQGDGSAQAEVYRLVSPRMMGLAVRVLNDRGAAQEVVQDTFVQMIEHAAELREPGALLPWLRRVAVNHCLMRLRSPWHARRVAVGDDGEDGGPGLLDTGDGAVSAARMESEPDIQQALARLGAETRMVVWLHDVEGYTHKEIGSLMGKTASFSKSQLARGYAKLEQWYQKQGPDHDGQTRRQPRSGRGTNSAHRSACTP
ncbi:MAG: RNA polymerase sigma factor [Pseudomonadota bacterium]